MKYCAVGVVVATTTPLPFAVRIEFVIEFNVSVLARASAPALEKVDVAEPPKYAVSNTESRVEEA